MFFRSYSRNCSLMFNFRTHFAAHSLVLRHLAYCPTRPTLAPHAPRAYVLRASHARAPMRPRVLTLARCGMYCPHTPMRALPRVSPRSSCSVRLLLSQTCLAFVLPTSTPMLLPQLGTRPQAKPWHQPSRPKAVTLAKAPSEPKH